MLFTIKKELWGFALINVLMLLSLSAWLYQQNQPVSIIAPTSLAQNKLQCVSYAPFYKKGESPLVEGMWIKPEQIEHDLKLLSNISHCVRTYSVSQGMDYVPKAAAELGMKVYLGAWIGWTDADNVAEIKLATSVANANPDTVKALIIGNEVFLRGEQDEAAMKRYFALAKSLSDTPITYADVWEFWIKHQQMAQYVDFQTVHILPYWENNPVAIADAVQHAENVMTKLEEIFTNPILIGETGWPSVGRQRSESAPSAINQARYVREFIQKAHEQQWQYNIIEAIDQPWKRSLEGTVGGYWGLMTADLKPKFSLAGPVSERHDQTRLIVAGIVGALLFLGLATALKEGRLNAYIGLGALGALAGVMLMLKQAYLIAACRDWLEWLALGGLGMLGTLLVGMQPWLISGHCQQAKKILSVVKAVFLYSAAVTGYLIYFDGRYRDFPILLFALPAIVMLVNMQLRPRVSIVHWIIYGVPAALSVMFAALCFEKELTNNAALLWLVLSILLALSNWPRQQNNLSQK
jgi:exo-beta-1,3-glucanase (GH17 family)